LYSYFEEIVGDPTDDGLVYETGANVAPITLGGILINTVSLGDKVMVGDALAYILAFRAASSSVWRDVAFLTGVFVMKYEASCFELEITLHR
jgi:predicted deacylase